MVEVTVGVVRVGVSWEAEATVEVETVVETAVRCAARNPPIGKTL